jgi:hypothetical protein
MIGISSGIGTPRLPSKSAPNTPMYVKLSTNSWSASTASSPDERCHVFRMQCSRPPTAYAAWPMLSLWIEPGHEVKYRLSVVAVGQNRDSAAISKPEQF